MTPPDFAIIMPSGAAYHVWSNRPMTFKVRNQIAEQLARWESKDRHAVLVGMRLERVGGCAMEVTCDHATCRYEAPTPETLAQVVEKHRSETMQAVEHPKQGEV